MLFGSFAIMPKSPNNHALPIVRRHWHRYHRRWCLCTPVHTSPNYRIKHKNFIFGTDMHTYPLYIHIKYLTIMTYSCFMAAIYI